MNVHTQTLKRCINFLVFVKSLLILIIFMGLISCQSRVEDVTENLGSNIPNQKEIIVVDDFVVGNRQEVTIIPNVLLNDKDRTGNGELFILDWTQTSVGSIVYDSDGEFIFTPTNNIPSGEITFEYTVGNSIGKNATGVVTILVQESWGGIIEHNTAPSLNNQSTFTDAQGNIFLIYYGASPIIQVYDVNLELWLSPKIIPDLAIPDGLSRICVPSNCRIQAQAIGNGKLMIFQYNTFQEIYTRIYDITDQSISTQELLLRTTTTFENFLSYKDYYNNILVLVNTNLSSGNELWGRWYSVDDNNWKQQHVVADANNGRAWINKNSVFVTMDINNTLSSNHYDVVNDRWLGVEPISDSTLGGYVMPQFKVDDNGNILALWVQNTIPNRQNIYGRFYSYNFMSGSWDPLLNEPISISDIPGTAIESISIVELNKGNYSIIWHRRRESNLDTGSYFWSNYFNADSKSFNKMSSAVYGGPNRVRESLIVDKFDNITVISEKENTNGDSSIGSIFVNRMSSYGVWGTEFELESLASRPIGLGELAFSTTDSIGNVVVIYHKTDGLTYELVANEYSNTSNKWLKPSTIVSSENKIVLFRIYTLASGQLSVVWSEEYLDQGNNTRFQMLSKKRLGESIWDVNKVIVDQLLGPLEPIELYIDDQNNEKLFWYVNRYTDNTAIMTANYYSDNDQWSPSTTLVSSVQKVEIDYDIYPISSGKIQVIGTKRTKDLLNSSATLFSIDYR